ncbi:MAG: SprB repeat-containing protein [Bacteroidetes bacterium]|nr:SprB repeat-containing protein [Bacteroidota bacterium]
MAKLYNVTKKINSQFGSAISGIEKKIESWLLLFSLLFFSSFNCLMAQSEEASSVNAYVSIKQNRTTDNVNLSELEQQNRQLPVGFIENKGQLLNSKGEIANNVLYSLTFKGLNIFITNTGLRYAFTKREEKEEEDICNNAIQLPGDRKKRRMEISIIDMELEGASISKDKIVKGALIETGRIDYYTGYFPQGIFDVKTYEKITFTNIYPGIDWVLYIKQHSNESPPLIKQDFIVRPGADPKMIRLLYKGNGKLKSGNGRFINIVTPLGNLNEGELICYEEEKKTIISSKYEIKTREGDSQENFSKEILFDLGSYDLKQNLVIDPALDWLTLYTGNDLDGFNGISTDSNGNIIVCGYTASLDYPLLDMGGGAYYKNTFGGRAHDITILKFSNTGQRLWATFYGGIDAKTEWAEDIEIDSKGNIFIIGTTECNDFPTQSAGGISYFEPSYTGRGFVLKFSSAGIRQWGTYLKGTYYAYSGHIDKMDNLYIVGLTVTGSLSFLNGTLPLLGINAGSYLQTDKGNDAFIMKFDSSLQLKWSTYFGGTEVERAQSVITNSNGYVFVSGFTRSSDMPIKNKLGAYNQSVKTSNTFLAACYLTEFSTTGQLLWSTYLGGTGNSWADVLAMNSSDHLFVVGTTSNGFPLVNPGGGAYFDNIIGSAGGDDIFISEFDPTGAQVWATFFGGSGGDGRGTGLMGAVIDNCDNLYITGRGCTTGFPYKDAGCGSFYANDKSGSNCQVPFIAWFNVNRVFNWCVSLKGYGWGEDLAVDQNRNLFIIGEYQLPGGVVKDPGGGAYFDGVYQGGGTGDDAFVGKFSPIFPSFIQSQNNPSCSCNGSATINVSCGNPNYSYVWSNGSSTMNVASTTNTVTGLCAGTYTVTAYMNCNDTLQATYTMIAGSGSVTPGISGITTICNGSNTILTANGGGTYVWSTGATTTAITVSPTSNTTYTLTANNGGCTGSTTIVVTVNPAVSVIVTPSNITCNGGTNGSATATGNSGTAPFTYNWSNVVPGSGFQVSGLSAGIYSVTVTDNKGCTGTSSVTIAAPPSLSGQFTKGTANCAGCSCKEWLMVTATGGTNPYSYSWPASGGIVNRYRNQLCPGSYTINITDKNGCSVNINLTAP